MTTTIEYNGFKIEAATKQQRQPPGWTLEVRLTPAGRRTGARRCRAPNIYDSQERAVECCFEFGRRIVDGRMLPRTDKKN